MSVDGGHICGWWERELVRRGKEGRRRGWRCAVDCFVWAVDEGVMATHGTILLGFRIRRSDNTGQKFEDHDKTPGPAQSGWLSIPRRYLDFVVILTLLHWGSVGDSRILFT